MRSTQQQIESFIEILSSTEPQYIHTRRAAAQALLDLLNYQVDMQTITTEEAAAEEASWHRFTTAHAEELRGEL